MGCCNVRTMSYISASLQLVCCVIGLLATSIASVVVNSDKFQEVDETGLLAEATNITLVIFVILCILGISLLVTLIVGIQQKRLTLVSIYVYTNYVFLILGVILIVASVAIEIGNGSPVGDILMDLLIDLFLVGLEIVLLAPIFILHRRMREPPILPTTYSAPPPVVKPSKEY